MWLFYIVRDVRIIVYFVSWLIMHQITLAALCFATLAGIFIGALIQFLEDNKKATQRANAK